MTIQEERLVFVPEAVLAEAPKGDVQHFKDEWWVEHPERGLALFRQDDCENVYPQCNLNRAITNRLAADLYPNMQVRQVPSAFLRVDYNGRLYAPKGAYA